MTNKEKLKMMTKKYNWLCEQYAILTDRDEMSLKFNKKIFKELMKPVLQDLKALELIKEKRVNVRAFLKCCHRIDGLLIYNNQCYNEGEKESKELTQEEYDLLKRWLNENND